MNVVLFPSESFRPKKIDPHFEAEEAAARAAGLTTALIDHTRIEEGDVEGAASRVPKGPADALYRGWMLTVDHYACMHTALKLRGVFLVNTPYQYRTCHHLPDNYRLLEGKTPRSVWMPIRGEVDFAAVAALLAPFGDRPIIVKDYVKSQKHAWAEACFIPSASDARAVQRVVRRFLELQGDELNVGLVFREFLPLEIVGSHPKSGMPLAAEFRIFWAGGEPILSHRYWGDLTTFDVPLPMDDLRAIAARIPSRFFTMDVAFMEGGDWTIVELGDGQTAGLPSPELAGEFFTQIAAAARVVSGPHGGLWPSPTWNIVHTVDDWYDGPLSGVTEFNGMPYSYRSVALDAPEWDADDDRFELTPLSQEALAAALEIETMWARWREARAAGILSDDPEHAKVLVFGVLPADAARHDELKRILSAARSTAADHSILFRGEFDLARNRVRWTPLARDSRGSAGQEVD